MQLNIREKREVKKIYILLAITVLVTAIFVGIGLNSSNASYLLSKRIPKVAAIVISGGCIAFASIIFQTITNNRILKNLFLCLFLLLNFFAITPPSLIIIDPNK